MVKSIKSDLSNVVSGVKSMKCNWSNVVSSEWYVWVQRDVLCVPLNESAQAYALWCRGECHLLTVCIENARMRANARLQHTRVRPHDTPEGASHVFSHLPSESH